MAEEIMKVMMTMRNLKSTHYRSKHRYQTYKALMKKVATKKKRKIIKVEKTMKKKLTRRRRKRKVLAPWSSIWVLTKITLRIYWKSLMKTSYQHQDLY